eukprot:symbB.v1.2.013072.t2/scaffold918.1/size152295/3
MGDAEFLSDVWRSPLDPNWGKDQDPTNPESVLGLASEFGCGSDGPDCPPGWGLHEDQTASNGLLGYKEAGLGEPFLKIGVGKLKKGSCDWTWNGHTCETDTNYHFNSRYQFVEAPVWTVTHPSNDALDLEHSASLGPWGYRLHRHLKVIGNTLVVRSELTNIGSKAFSTVQYTHNFLAFNGHLIGAPLTLQFGQDLSSYHEPGYEQGWSVPLDVHFAYTAPNRWTLAENLPQGAVARQSILTQFEGARNLNASGGYIASLGNTAVASVLSNGKKPLYGYKFFAQASAACPEPLQQISLAPAQTTHWEQRLAFSLQGTAAAVSSFFTGVGSDVGENRQCGAQPSSSAVVKEATSLEMCMTHCLLYLNCKGLQYEHSAKRCCIFDELWTRSDVSSSRAKMGYYCLKLITSEGSIGNTPEMG